MAVGKTLKETRKEKGISIEEASKETKIRKKYILALENDEFSKIPGKVYQKAFLKTYADYLGIEKDNILEEYQLDQQLNGVEEESLGRKRRSKKNKKTTFFNFISKITGKAMIIIIIILLLGGVIGYNLLVMNGDNGGNENNGLAEVEQEIEEEVTNEEDSAENLLNEEAENDSENEETENEEAETDSETEENSDNLLETGIDPTDLDDDSMDLDEETVVDLEDEEDIAEISEQEPEEDQNGEANEAEAPEETAENENEDSSSYFNIIASGESWIRVVVDGETEFEGIINDGDILEYESVAEVQLRVGNAAAISVEYGEEEVGPLGGSGQVVEETFQL